MTEAQTGTSPLAEMVRASRLPSPAECKRVREKAGVSQQQVAEELGVSAMAVSYWERGTWTPAPTKAIAYRALLEQLADAAGTRIAGTA